MKFLGIEKRDVYVAFEFSLSEMQNIARFFSKAVPMYNNIYGDSEQELIKEIYEVQSKLETTIEEIENGS